MYMHMCVFSLKNQAKVANLHFALEVLKRLISVNHYLSDFLKYFCKGIYIN